MDGVTIAFRSVQWVVQIDHHPPLYYLALHAWLGWLGDSVAAARGLSALAGTLAIPVFFVAARRLAGPRTVVGATILVVLSLFLVRYGQEARTYSLLTLAVAATLAATAWLLIDRQPTRGRVVLVVAAFGTTQAAAMWLHNTATVLLPVALNVGVLGPWLVWRLGRMARPWPAQEEPGWLWRWLAAQGSALALWLPWSAAFLVQSRVAGRPLLDAVSHARLCVGDAGQSDLCRFTGKSAAADDMAGLGAMAGVARAVGTVKSVGAAVAADRALVDAAAG